MELEEFYSKFINYKTQIEGISENSAKQYIYRLKDFVDSNNIKNFEELQNSSVDMVKNWLFLLSQKGNKSRSRNIRLTALKEVFKFIKEELKLDIDDDILRIPFAKVPKRESKYLDSEVVYQLIDFIRDGSVKTGLAIMFATGVRYCELIQITTDDIARGSASIIGKGNKEREIYFTPFVQSIATNFINNGRKKILEKHGKQTNVLIINKIGNIYPRRSFEKIMKRWAKKFHDDTGLLDWYEHFSPHKLRHSFATDQLINRKNDITTVRDEMGHSNIATTDNYAHSNKERVRMAMLGENSRKQNKEETETSKLLNKILSDKDLYDKVVGMVLGSGNIDEKKE